MHNSIKLLWTPLKFRIKTLGIIHINKIFIDNKYNIAVQIYIFIHSDDNNNNSTFIWIFVTQTSAQCKCVVIQALKICRNPNIITHFSPRMCPYYNPLIFSSMHKANFWWKLIEFEMGWNKTSEWDEQWVEI